METDLRINTPDGKLIYGALRQTQTASNKLVIHLHGMTHSHQHYLPMTAADYFEQKGFDHFRFSFYWIEKNTRRLTDATLSTHTQDIETVLTHFRDKYEELYIIGHSLGGLAALITNPQNITAMSLWDPAMDVTNFWKTGAYLTHMPERKQYQLDYGNVYVLSEDMIEEIKQYPNEKCLELAAKITTPTQFIIPELSIFLASPHTAPEQYKKSFAGKFEIQNINNANHTFTYEGNADKLFDATLEWFLSPSCP